MKCVLKKSKQNTAQQFLSEETEGETTTYSGLLIVVPFVCAHNKTETITKSLFLMKIAKKNVDIGLKIWSKSERLAVNT